MSFVAGTKLGRYEIRSKIGEGGMGEVYLALDTELGRTVAIKILPEALASNQLRLAVYSGSESSFCFESPAHSNDL